MDVSENPSVFGTITASVLDTLYALCVLDKTTFTLLLYAPAYAGLCPGGHGFRRVHEVNCQPVKVTKLSRLLPAKLGKLSRNVFVKGKLLYAGVLSKF